MKVSIKDLSVKMDLGNNGITFDVYDGETFLGDLKVARGNVEWCKGRTRAGNGVKVNWKDLITFFEGAAPKKTAKKTAKKVSTKRAKMSAAKA